jgi:hypothetical protein
MTSPDIAAMEASPAGKIFAARGFAAARTDDGELVWHKSAPDYYVRIVVTGSRFDAALYKYEDDNPLDVGLLDDPDTAADWGDEALASVSDCHG